MTTPYLRPRRRLFKAIMILNFSASLAIFAPIGLLLTLKLNGIDPAHLAVAISHATGLGALVALFMNPIAGAISDRTPWRSGKRRTWMGFGANNALVADQVPTEERGTVSGAVGLVSNLAIFAGMGLVNLLNHAGDLSQWGALAAVGVAGAGTAIVLIRDTPASRRPGTHRRGALGKVCPHPRKDPSFYWAWLARLLFRCSSGLAVIRLSSGSWHCSVCSAAWPFCRSRTIDRPWP
ncbi:MAG: hypothetical protein IRZ10_09680 [Thermoflavifilum sp.]|nr:hypothetical protein [Thermoflavifilum sp.]MCL6514677.1 hypothetical protein [Alicyclobacillus sp.]